MQSKMLTGGKWVPASCVIGSTCSSPWVMGQVEEIPPPCCCSEVRTRPRERARVSPRLGSGGVGLQCGALPGGSGERSTDLKGRASQPDPPGTRLLLYSWRNSICPVRAGMAKVDGGGGHLSLTAGGGDSDPAWFGRGSSWPLGPGPGSQARRTELRWWMPHDSADPRLMPGWDSLSPPPWAPSGHPLQARLHKALGTFSQMDLSS